jgi:hypothetical protein
LVIVWGFLLSGSNATRIGRCGAQLQANAAENHISSETIDETKRAHRALAAQ